MAVRSPMIIFNQLEHFISAKHSYATVKFVWPAPLIGRLLHLPVGDFESVTKIARIYVLNFSYFNNFEFYF